MFFDLNEESYFENELGKIHFRYLKNNNNNNNTICILPGFSFSSNIFLNFSKELFNLNYNILIMDYFGRGYSILSNENEKHSISLYSKQFFSLINYLNLNDIILISISFGSLIINKIILENFINIKKIIYISPLQFILNSTNFFQRYLLSKSKFGPWLLNHLVAYLTPLQIKNQLIDPINNSELLWSIVSTIMYQSNINPTFHKATSNLIEELNPNKINQSYQYNNLIPKYILLGEKDNSIDINLISLFWLKKKNFKIDIIKNGGNLMYLENLKEIILKINDFIQTN